jgi:hypothetical protein
MSFHNNIVVVEKNKNMFDIANASKVRVSWFSLFLLGEGRSTTFLQRYSGHTDHHICVVTSK